MHDVFQVAPPEGYYRQYMGPAEMHKSLNALDGILTGILADGIVNEQESSELQNWYALHEPLIDRQPFKELLPAIRLAFEEDVLDIEEAEGIRWLCERYLDKRQDALYFDGATSAIQQLEGMLHGFIADGKLTDEELAALGRWLAENEQLAGIYPYDEIYSLLVAAQSDGVVTQDERNMLTAFFSTFVDLRESYNLSEGEMQRLQKEYSVGGICAVDPQISFEGKVFCFTGEFAHGKKAFMQHTAEERGAEVSSSVAKRVDYLIVGAEGNDCWAYSCYGRKVEKAVELRKNGHHILIVHENDYWDQLPEVGE